MAKRRSRQNPFTNTLVRYGIGASDVLLLAVIAYNHLNGTIQPVTYVIAVLDFIVVSQMLKQATV